MEASKRNRIFFLVLIVATIGVTYAQSTPPNPNPPPPGMPINSGIFLLSFLAVAYGYIKKK